MVGMMEQIVEFPSLPLPLLVTLSRHLGFLLSIVSEVEVSLPYHLTWIGIFSTNQKPFDFRDVDSGCQRTVSG